MPVLRTYAVRWIMAVLVVASAGCGGSPAGPRTGSPVNSGEVNRLQAGKAGNPVAGDGSGARGILQVSLTDGPASGFDAVNVTVAKVRVHRDADASEQDQGWTEITLEPAKKINLLSLTNGVLERLGTAMLPAGTYTQIRLVLSANTGAKTGNSVILAGSTEEIPLETPGAVQSGIKLIDEFEVAAGEERDLVLDFDALKSVVRRGNGSYALKPVIRVVSSQASPQGINGFVASSLLGSGVMVSAQVNGAVIGSAIPDVQTGGFFLARLEAGNYDVVITADGHATAVVADVPVAIAAGAALVTAISTSAEPITLPAASMQSVSGMVTLIPATAASDAAVSMKQELPDGLVVNVRTEMVDQLSGAFAFSLPVDVPLLGRYGAGSLPISFSTADMAMGEYTAEASATGYRPQSATVNVSESEVYQIFFLVP